MKKYKVEFHPYDIAYIESYLSSRDILCEDIVYEGDGPIAIEATLITDKTEEEVLELVDVKRIISVSTT